MAEEFIGLFNVLSESRVKVLDRYCKLVVRGVAFRFVESSWENNQLKILTPS